MTRTASTVFTSVFGYAYVALACNLALVTTTAPFLLVALSARPTASWPLLLLTAPLIGPALAGCFGVFAGYSADGTTTPWRTFARCWARGLRRSLAVGALVTVVVGVLVVDVVAVWGSAIGALTIPFFAALAAVAVLTGVVALVLVGDPDGGRTGLGLRRTLAVAAVGGLRRWYLGVVSLLVLALLVSAVGLSPVLALGLAAAPLLYVVWAGGRSAVQAALPQAPASVRDAGPTRSRRYSSTEGAARPAPISSPTTGRR